MMLLLGLNVLKAFGTIYFIDYIKSLVSEGWWSDGRIFMLLVGSR